MQMKSASRVKSPLAIEVEMPLSGGISLFNMEKCGVDRSVFSRDALSRSLPLRGEGGPLAVDEVETS